MVETQATTTEDSTTTTIAISYTSHDFERGTDEEKVAYDLRSSHTTPDELDQDVIGTVYDDRVEFDLSSSTVEQADDVVEILEAAYHGVERDQIAEVDRTEHRSPMIGDVFEFDGTAYVVARFGFDELETSVDVFEGSR